MGSGLLAVANHHFSYSPWFDQACADIPARRADRPPRTAPTENALVLAVDEKSQIQALDRTAPCLPMLPTTPARMTHDYVRNGTTSLFAAFDLANGLVIAQRHRHQEFLRLLKFIDAAVPKGLDLHLVLDNYATSKTPEIHTWLLRHPRFHRHFTPISSSWLNLVKRWFAELTNRKLRRSAHRSVTELEAGIHTWINAWNKDPEPFVWVKSADEILETLAAYCVLICDLGSCHTFCRPACGRAEVHGDSHVCADRDGERRGPGQLPGDSRQDADETVKPLPELLQDLIFRRSCAHHRLSPGLRRQLVDPAHRHHHVREGLASRSVIVDRHPFQGIQAALDQSHLLVVVHTPMFSTVPLAGASPLRQALACKCSCGPRPPTRSSEPSPSTAVSLMTRDDRLRARRGRSYGPCPRVEQLPPRAPRTSVSQLHGRRDDPPIVV
jgi:transposase